jgi:hypothetical protein
MHLRNVGLKPRDYTALCPRKLSSSYSQPGKADISHNTVNCSYDYSFQFKTSFERCYGDASL